MVREKPAAVLRASQRYEDLVRALGRERGVEYGWVTEVAELLGTSQPFLWQILDGRRNAGPETIERAVATFGIRREYFYDEPLQHPTYRGYLEARRATDDSLPAMIRRKINDAAHLLSADALAQLEGMATYLRALDEPAIDAVIAELREKDGGATPAAPAKVTRRAGRRTLPKRGRKG